MRGRIMLFLVGLAILILPIAMCWRSPLFNKNYAYIARQNSRLILDSPEVQNLLNGEGRNVAEREAFYSLKEAALDLAGIERMSEFVQHPEQHMPKHFEFLGAIARQPAEVVPKGSSARFLSGSNAPCGHLPDSNIYAKFRITSGPMKDSEGWACNVSEIGPVFGGP